MEDSKGCGVNMMTEKQIEEIKRIFNKCIEVNKKKEEQKCFLTGIRTQVRLMLVYVFQTGV